MEVLAPWNLAGATELLPQKAGCDTSASTPLLPALFDNSGLETYFKNHCTSHGMKIRICMRYVRYGVTDIHEAAMVRMEGVVRRHWKKSARPGL